MQHDLGIYVAVWVLLALGWHFQRVREQAPPLFASIHTHVDVADSHGLGVASVLPTLQNALQQLVKG